MYAGIFASTIIVTVGALVVRKSLGSMSYGVGRFDWMVFVAGLGALIFAYRQRQRFGDGHSHQAEQWWGDHSGQALLVWGLLEVGALIGAVLLFSTGRFPVYAVLAGLALAGLVLTSPSRLAGG